MNGKRAFAAAAALSALFAFPYASSAQTGDDPHAGHHAPAQAAAQPSIPTQIPGRATGMMGGGMMGGGMMGGMMMGQGGPGPGMATGHIEGRIAFLKTELRITDAQNGVWNGFADALRGSYKQLTYLRDSMKGGAAPADFADQLSQREKVLSVRLENTRAMRTSFAALDAKLTPDQKKMASELLTSPMGMGMMAMGARPPRE